MNRPKASKLRLYFEGGASAYNLRYAQYQRLRAARQNQKDQKCQLGLWMKRQHNMIQDEVSYYTMNNPPLKKLK